MIDLPCLNYILYILQNYRIIHFIASYWIWCNLQYHMTLWDERLSCIWGFNFASLDHALVFCPLTGASCPGPDYKWIEGRWGAWNVDLIATQVPWEARLQADWLSLWGQVVSLDQGLYTDQSHNLINLDQVLQLDVIFFFS